MSCFNSFRSVATTALTVVSLLAAGGAQASLVTRLNGKAVYDDVAKLSWLQDANYAQTSGYDSDGRMNWSTAMAWASNLTIEGVAGWRLPGGPMDYYAQNQSASEMGNLFHNVLGGVAGQDIATTQNANYAFFKNIQSINPIPYWTGVELDSVSSRAWGFHFMVGYLYYGYEDGLLSSTPPAGALYGWPVHDGDVGGNPVPTPGTLALLVAGLLGWVGVKRSRHRAGA
jgi:hypothetical protein